MANDTPLRTPLNPDNQDRSESSTTLWNMICCCFTTQDATKPTIEPLRITPVHEPSASFQSPSGTDSSQLAYEHLKNVWGFKTPPSGSGRESYLSTPSSTVSPTVDL